MELPESSISWVQVSMKADSTGALSFLGFTRLLYCPSALCSQTAANGGFFLSCFIEMY